MNYSHDSLINLAHLAVMFPEVPYYGGRESSTCCNFRKHMQIKETTSSIWQRTRCKYSQHNQKRNALQIKCIGLWAFAACCEHLQRVALFVCVGRICTICCQNDENVFLIFWWFLYLHVFSEVAACWALSATVPYGLLHCLFKKTDIHHTVKHCTFYIHYLSNVWGQ